nr:hypothetical protein [Candidatus Sigynarchaeum springense]
MARTITPRLNCPDDAYDTLVKLRVIHHHVSHEVDALKDGASSVTSPVPRVWGEYVNDYFKNIAKKIKDRETELDSVSKAIKDLETSCFGK